MNRRRWIGLVLSIAWLAGVAGYEAATVRSSAAQAYGVAAPLCQQTEEGNRARCIEALARFYTHLEARHAGQTVGLAILACSLGWVAGLLVIKRRPL